MALFTTNGEIPPSYRRIDRFDAPVFQMDLIQNLCPKNKSFFVRNGPEISATITSLASAVISYKIRKTVNVNVSSPRTGMTIILFPNLIHYGLQSWFIRDNIIIQKWACPYCYHLKSSLLFMMFGGIYPVAASAIASFSTARVNKIYDVPPLNHWNKIYKFFLERTRPFSKMLVLNVVFQAVAGIFIVHQEAKENNDFNQNIDKYLNDYNKNHLNATDNKKL